MNPILSISDPFVVINGGGILVVPMIWAKSNFDAELSKAKKF